jgi:hypothetical protein
MAAATAWPTPQDYNEAIQNLRLNAADPELQHGVIQTDAMGLPRPITGAFASVYRVDAGKKRFAVRCFLRHIADSKWRYEQISQFVQNDDLSYTVGFDFQPQGILVRGSRYPILKMEWVEGKTLDNYLIDRKMQVSADLAESFKIMCLRLNAAGIAHGDLQHGNIMIRDEQFYLVDYDGMYVPSMKGKDSNELGHRNYQHPQRDVHTFGTYLDNFPAWVIYVSLKAMAIDPSLAKRLGAGEDCLLFRRQDFIDPLNSCAFAALEQHQNQEIQRLAKFLRSLVSEPPFNVPPLSAQAEITGRMRAVNPDAPKDRAQEMQMLAARARPQPEISVKASAPTRANSSGTVKHGQPRSPQTVQDIQGHWTGKYFYQGSIHGIKFEADLTYGRYPWKPWQLTGTIRDNEFGEADIVGDFNFPNIKFEKRYRYSRSTIYYDGTVNPSATEMTGKWKIMGARGTWVAQRVP